MAQSKKQIKNTYPLPVYNYRVTIGELTLGFSEVSGLNVSYEPVTYKHGYSFAMGARIIPGMRQPVRLTLKRGIAKGSDFLAGWLHDVYAEPFKNKEQDVVLDLCDETGQSVVRWTIYGAMPIKLDAPAFNASSNEVALESLELVAHEIKIDYHP